MSILLVCLCVIMDKCTTGVILWSGNLPQRWFLYHLSSVIIQFSSVLEPQSNMAVFCDVTNRLCVTPPAATNQLFAKRLKLSGGKEKCFFFYPILLLNFFGATVTICSNVQVLWAEGKELILIPCVCHKLSVYKYYYTHTKFDPEMIWTRNLLLDVLTLHHRALWPREILLISFCSLCSVCHKCIIIIIIIEWHASWENTLVCHCNFKYLCRVCAQKEV